MTQEDVRRLLDELGGEATVENISVRAKEELPERTLHTYVGQTLRNLERKGFVTEVGDKAWKLTEKGKTTSLSGVQLTEVEKEVDQSELQEYGLEVTNLVGTIETGREFDLNILASSLPDANYHPESSPFLVYRPIESATLLVPTNGLISVVGSNTVAQTREAIGKFVDEMEKLGISIDVSPDDVLIQNIVVKGDFGVELDLNVLSVGLGLERCEYEPEQFPGLIFRSERGATVLIFRTGSYLINGAKSYASALQVAFDVYDELQSLGIDVSI